MIYNEDCSITLKQLKNLDLIIFSPPYNINKEYEKKYTLKDYITWFNELIPKMYKSLSENGSICVQIGNFIDTGKVYPLDCLLFNSFLEIGFIPRNRIVWSFGHGLHCKKRFSGRHETILWFTKSEKYTFNLDPIRIPSKYPNKKHYKGNKKRRIIR